MEILLAGPVGFEPTSHGFGGQYVTITPEAYNGEHPRPTLSHITVG